MPVSNAQLFIARQRTAVDDLARVQLKLIDMQKLCPQHSEEIAVSLKALARVQKKLLKINEK